MVLPALTNKLLHLLPGQRYMSKTQTLLVDTVTQAEDACAACKMERPEDSAS